ncbi:hypothetical protein [Sneathiella chinensis]|uniref:hypothetical protein n=1 Tax=Sneathiella chinensis TaxID=349750 RepID=UPI00146BC4EF|nr:hypothetical protein [Sneathiella chinensis]
MKVVVNQFVNSFFSAQSAQGIFCLAAGSAGGGLNIFALKGQRAGLAEETSK